MRLRRTRLVRLHLVEPFPTVEGVGGKRVHGHYVLERAKILEAEDRTYTLEGVLEVPAERVIFRQVLAA